VWLLVAGVLAACAPARIELDPRVRDVVPAASVVHVVVYPADPPSLLTATAAATGGAFGVIGGAIVGARAASVGKDLMAKHKVVDDLSSQLANALGDQLKDTLPNLKRATTVPAGDAVEDLRRAGLRPYVLDVRSRGRIIYYPGSWSRYRLIYDSRARLVDTDNGRVVWLGACEHKGPEDADSSPTLDQLEAEDGVAYRRMLADATAVCATELLKQYRGEAPPAS
jgi:hypothetical protein